MPVLTRQSTAGTGEQTVSIPLSEIVLVGVSLSNPNETSRAEVSEIRLYSGTSAEGINFATLMSGWTIGSHSLYWRGRQHLKGDYVLVGLIKHLNSIKHKLTVFTEVPGLAGKSIWNWNDLWRGGA